MEKRLKAPDNRISPVSQPSSPPHPALSFCSAKLWTSQTGAGHVLTPWRCPWRRHQIGVKATEECWKAMSAAFGLGFLEQLSLLRNVACSSGTAGPCCRSPCAPCSLLRQPIPAAGASSCRFHSPSLRQVQDFHCRRLKRCETGSLRRWPLRTRWQS